MFTIFINQNLFTTSLKSRLYPYLIDFYPLTHNVVLCRMLHNQLHYFVHGLRWPFCVMSPFHHLHVLVLPLEILVQFLAMLLINQSIIFSPDKYDSCCGGYIFYLVLNAQILKVKIGFLFDIRP